MQLHGCVSMMRCVAYMWWVSFGSECTGWILLWGPFLTITYMCVTFILPHLYQSYGISASIISSTGCGWVHTHVAALNARAWMCYCNAPVQVKRWPSWEPRQLHIGRPLERCWCFPSGVYTSKLTLKLERLSNLLTKLWLGLLTNDIVELRTYIVHHTRYWRCEVRSQKGSQTAQNDCA